VNIYRPLRAELTEVNEESPTTKSFVLIPNAFFICYPDSFIK
jgi:hypothetical protein